MYRQHPPPSSEDHRNSGPQLAIKQVGGENSCQRRRLAVIEPALVCLSLTPTPTT